MLQTLCYYCGLLLASNVAFSASQQPLCSADLVSTMSDIVRQLEELKSYRHAPTVSNTTFLVKVNLVPLRLVYVDDTRTRIEIDLLIIIH